MMSFRWSALLGVGIWLLVEYAALTRASEHAHFAINFTDIVMLIASLALGAAGLTISFWERLSPPVNTHVSGWMVLTNVRYALLRVVQLLIGGLLICSGAAALFVALH